MKQTEKTVTLITPHLLTSQEVQDLMGISRRTLCQWVREGKCPAIRIGRAYRYDYSALLKWFASQATSYKEPVEPEVKFNLVSRPGEDIAD